MTDDELRTELLRRMEVDQDIRRQAAESSSQEFMARWMDIDRDNTTWLWSVVRVRGWPLWSQVGQDGEAAAWLLAQHADAAPDIQREFHSALSAAVDQQEAKRAHLAYLADRVRVNAGRPQLYGTQFVEDGTGFRPHPIEDRDQLDLRRASVGLQPFAEYEFEIRRFQDGNG